MLIPLPPRIDPNSPSLQAAEKACKPYLPAGVPTGAPKGG